MDVEIPPRMSRLILGEDTFKGPDGGNTGAVGQPRLCAHSEAQLDRRNQSHVVATNGDLVIANHLPLLGLATAARSIRHYDVTRVWEGHGAK